VPNLVGYEYDGLWTTGASESLPAGLHVLGKATVDPVNGRPEQEKFVVRYDFGPSKTPSAGLFSTQVNGGGSWALFVVVSSASGPGYVEYLPGDGKPSHTVASGTDYSVIRLGKDFEEPGWKPLVRDLVADYALGLGQPAPKDLVVRAIQINGSLSLAPIVFTPKGGEPTTLTFADNPSALGWKTIAGDGSVETGGVGPNGERRLSLRPAESPYSGAEADTVIMRDSGRGTVIAVGTVQWSWALDSLGNHADGSGNVTSVDPRIQGLTKNILRALVGP